MIETLVRKKQRASKIFSLLKRKYPYSKYHLYYTSPHELLVANILSYDCTRERVNTVAKKLFNKYHSPIDFAYCNLDSLAEDIRSTGNQNNKAKKIKKACLIIVEKYSGVVPCSIDDLLGLPGVEKETAKCIMGEIYNVPTIVIDSQLARIMKLLGLKTVIPAVLVK